MDRIFEEIKNIAINYPDIEKIVLFGSRARGDNSLKSDIDLAVYGKDAFGEFLYDLETKVNTLLEFDVTFVNEKCDEVFLEEIKNDGVLIYEKSGI